MSLLSFLLLVFCPAALPTHNTEQRRDAFSGRPATANIEITGGRLAAGTYIYSLFVDDKLIDSKKMILTR